MAVAGYNVYVDGTLRGTVLGTTAHLTGIPAGAHTAQVQAFDDSGNASALSSSVGFTVPSPETAGDTFPGLAISGAQGELAVDTTGATVQGSEPWDDARTVWFSWTPPAAGRYTFDTLLGQARDLFAGVVASIPNLEGYWRLNEGGYVAVDDSGLARHGVYLAGHALTTGGLEGGSKAAQLDGVEQRIELPDAPGLSIGPTGLTVVLLVRIDQPAPPHAAADSLVPLCEKPGEWSIAYASSAAPVSAGSFQAAAPRGDPAAVFADTDYVAVPEWVMLVATFDPPGSAGGVSLYRSNSQRSSQLYTRQPVRPAAPLPLEVGGPAGWLPGAVSDLAVWSRVLSADEINALDVEFAGIQNPVPFRGIVAQGTQTTPGVDVVMAFSHDVAAADTLLLVVASEYNPGSNTIFDSTFGNDYHRVIKSHQDPLKLGKLVVYRCDVTVGLSAGATLTVSPDNDLGVRAVMVAHYGPLGNLDTGGFALQTGIGGTPAATPAVHPTSRDDRVQAVHMELGPPGDTYNEDDGWTQQARIGTTSFDAGVPVQRIRTVAALADFNASGFPGGIVLTNSGALVPAGSEIHVRATHTMLGAGAQAISGAAGATWTTIKTDVDPDNLYRQTWYRGVLVADWPTGGTLTIAGSSTMTDFAAIASAWSGPATPAQVNSAKGSGQSMTTAPVNPSSLAGVASAAASWNGSVTDTIDVPEDWVELARAGTSRVAILEARPVAAITHQTTFNPDDLTGIRDWIVICGYLPPAVTSGGPLTPHETNVALTLSLLDSVPLGADVPYQPVLDPSPDPARKWITILLSFLRP